MLAASGTSFRLLDEGREPVGGVPLAARQHVRVHGHGHDRAGVAEPLRDHVDRHTCGQEDGGVRVSQIMKPDPWQRVVAELAAAPLDVAGELAGDVFGVRGSRSSSHRRTPFCSGLAPLPRWSNPQTRASLASRSRARFATLGQLM